LARYEAKVDREEKKHREEGSRGGGRAEVGSWASGGG